MFVQIKKICILAVVIAVIAVFADANDLAKFLATTNATTTTITTITTDMKVDLTNASNVEQTAKILAATTVEYLLPQQELSTTIATKLTTITTTSSAEQTKKSENGNDNNNVVNLQNTSRAADIVHVDVAATATTTEGVAGTSTQMNKTEMAVLNAQRHGHDTAGVLDDQRKLQKTNATKTLKNIKNLTTENSKDVNAGVYHIKLTELVNDQDREREREIAITTIIRKTKNNLQNIVDLYPLTKSEHIEFRTSVEQRQNLMPNDVESEQQQQQQHEMKNARRSVNDFTGKLLAEEDGGIITEIEQKFRIDELATKPPEHGNLERLDAAIAKVFAAAAAKEGTSAYPSQVFLDRRVKKSFDFPIHRATLPAAHNDFAQTKFSNGSQGKTLMHPEFSTTKFYNSKELYNEMMNNNNNNTQHYNTNNNNNNNNNNQQQAHNISKQYAVLTNPKFKTFRKSKDMNLPSYAPPTAVTLSTTMTTKTTTTISTTKQREEQNSQQIPAHGEVLSAVAVPTKTEAKVALERVKWRLKAILPVASNNNNNNNNSKNNNYANTQKHNVMQSTPVTTTDSQPTSITTTAAINTSSVGVIVKATNATTTTSYEADKVKTLTKAATATAATIIRQRINANTTTTATTRPTTTGSGADSTLPVTLSQHRATNPTKSSSKPISRPRTLSQLQLKINALECEIANVPPDAHLWRGNETHELLLPIMSANNCPGTESQDCYGASIASWDGEAEIQSGDILIVEINDALLNPHDKSNMSSAHNTQVYQVTRSGHEHCDVTEGILLDITPLVVDGRKLVTLYDKDLTEGVNLLIVVSELWGKQCVRLKVTTKTDNCGENADCSGKGVCYSSLILEEYECQCCSGFAGPHCEEIDACTPSPCTNNGICVDLSQGHEGNSYQCLCPYGYTGKNCQYEADPCNPAECLNGGTCVGNSTHFRCDCTTGYTGPLCQHSLNECESSPCVHGICVDQEDGFRCFCQPGFAGELCNFEYNECESNPCQNGGECIDHIGSYECRCTKGYTGNRCQTKVDFCANKVCPEGHRCIDRGNEFNCECPGGRNGPDCNQMSRTQCNVNPCTHGGTCWLSGDSFYCACRPGYTGAMCEDEFVVETVVSSSEFMVDDPNARNFNDKTFGSSVVLKSPIELHNAYFAAGVLAAAIFIVALVVTICHCKVNQTYRKFSTRSNSFFPILGFGRRPKPQGKLNKHWLSGKGLIAGASNLRANTNVTGSRAHLNSTTGNQQQQQQPQQQNVGQLHERPFQRHLAMNLENDMYYTVDFSENSQHSPLIQ